MLIILVVMLMLLMLLMLVLVCKKVQGFKEELLELSRGKHLRVFLKTPQMLLETHLRLLKVVEVGEI